MGLVSCHLSFFLFCSVTECRCFVASCVRFPPALERQTSTNGLSRNASYVCGREFHHILFFLCVCERACGFKRLGAADGDKQSLPRLEKGSKYHLDIQRGSAL